MGNDNENVAAKPETLDDALRGLIDDLNTLIISNQEIDPAFIREVSARCDRTHLESRFQEVSEKWPTWTRKHILEGIILAIARRDGDNRPFLALYMELNARKPVGKELPLKAWSVLLNWFEHNGQNAEARLPQWVCEYFYQAAREILHIRNSHTLAAAEQVSAVPRALGFVSQNWNIFAGDTLRMAEDLAALIYDNEGAKGRTGEARIEAVREKVGVADTRTARRYVARGRTRGVVVPWRK